MTIIIETNNVPDVLYEGDEISFDWRLHLMTSETIIASTGEEHIIVRAYDVTDPSNEVLLGHFGPYYGRLGAGDYYVPNPPNWYNNTFMTMPDHDVYLDLRLVKYSYYMVDDQEVEIPGTEVILGRLENYVYIPIYVPPVPSTGNLTITTNPSGADIYLNDEYKGQSPITISDLLVGDYILRVELDTYYPSEQTVTINAGDNSININLTPIPHGNLHINSEPDNALVKLNGTPRGYTPFILDDTFIGDYNIRLELDGYYPWTGTATVNTHDTTTVNATLERIPEPYGDLIINSEPTGATIYLDDLINPTGFVTPHTFTHIDAINHTIKLELLPYYNTWTGIRSVPPEGTATVDITLERAPIGNLVINSEPSGAEIYLNDTDTGYTTPHEFDDIDSGDYTIKLTYPGYFDWNGTATVDTGETTTVDAILEPGTCTLSINSIPSGADIYINDLEHPTGFVTPHRFIDMPIRLYRIKISHEGYLDYNTTVYPAIGMVTYFNPILEPAPASLVINSFPSGAEIYLNDTDTGYTTPHEFDDIDSGDYTIKLTLLNYQDYTQTVTINAGETITINATLESLPAHVTINSEPSGAEIYLNDTDTGYTTPHNFIFYIDGSHDTYNIKLTKPGYQDYTQTVILHPNDNINISPILEPLPCDIYIGSNPPGAEIYLDDTDTGNTTISEGTLLNDISQGNHTLKLTLEGYQTYEDTITVTYGEPNTFIIDLVPIPPPPPPPSESGNYWWLLLLLLAIILYIIYKEEKKKKNK